MCRNHGNENRVFISLITGKKQNRVFPQLGDEGIKKRLEFVWGRGKIDNLEVNMICNDVN